MQMWYRHTIDLYWSIINNEIMKSPRKQMELENIKWGYPRSEQQNTVSYVWILTSESQVPRI